jgi:hypothetical protein
MVHKNGHHPCVVNFYVPLTRIGGTSSLFLESRPGSEDWHSLEGNLGKNTNHPFSVTSPSFHSQASLVNCLGDAKQFAGANLYALDY